MMVRSNGLQLPGPCPPLPTRARTDAQSTGLGTSRSGWLGRGWHWWGRAESQGTVAYPSCPLPLVHPAGVVALRCAVKPLPFLLPTAGPARPKMRPRSCTEELLHMGRSSQLPPLSKADEPWPGSGLGAGCRAGSGPMHFQSMEGSWRAVA